jgi:hypothetical protein
MRRNHPCPRSQIPMLIDQLVQLPRVPNALEQYFDPSLTGARDADVPRAEDALKCALRDLDVSDIPVQDLRCTFGYYSSPLNRPLVRDYESLCSRLQPPYEQYDDPKNNGNENHRYDETDWIGSEHCWMNFDEGLFRLVHLSPLSFQGPLARQRPNSAAALMELRRGPAPRVKLAYEQFLVAGRDHDPLAAAVVNAQAIERQGRARQRISGGRDFTHLAQRHSPPKGAAPHAKFSVHQGIAGGSQHPERQSHTDEGYERGGPTSRARRGQYWRSGSQAHKNRGEYYHKEPPVDLRGKCQLLQRHPQSAAAASAAPTVAPACIRKQHRMAGSLQARCSPLLHVHISPLREPRAYYRFSACCIKASSAASASHQSQASTPEHPPMSGRLDIFHEYHRNRFRQSSSHVAVLGT